LRKSRHEVQAKPPGENAIGNKNRQKTPRRPGRAAAAPSAAAAGKRSTRVSYFAARRSKCRSIRYCPHLRQRVRRQTIVS